MIKPTILFFSTPQKLIFDSMVPHFEPDEHPLKHKRFHRKLFIAAGLYNLILVAYSIIDPQWLFRLTGMNPAKNPQLFSCMAMLVGLYGFVYLEIARVPERRWLLAAIGLLGKIAGPIGMTYLIATQQWKLGAIWIGVTNYFIWWIPFSIYLRDAWPFFRDDRQGSCKPINFQKQNRSMYSELLQADYLSLAPDVQQLHKGQFHGKGVFRVESSGGLAAVLLRAILPLPPSGKDIAVNVDVLSGSCCEQWNRSFANSQFCSVQYARSDGLLAEIYGLFEICFTLRVVDGALHYQSQAIHLSLGPYRIPLPPLFHLYASEKSTPEAQTMQVEFNVDDFRGARIFHYAGKLTVHKMDTLHG